MNKDIRDYRRLIGFVKPHIGILLGASVCMLIYSILNGISVTALIPAFDNIISGKEIAIPANVTIPLVISGLVEKINTLPPMRLLIILLIGMLVYFLLRNLFNFLQVYLMNDVSQRAIRDVKDAIYRKLLSLSMYFYSRNPTAKLMSRITYDAAIIRDSISAGLLDIILRPLEIMSHLVVMTGIVIFFGIPIKFVLTSIILFPCILLPAFFISKKLRQITTKSQEKMGDINTILFEIITGIRIVKAFSMQDYEYNKFKGENKSFYKLAMKSAKRINVISPINEFTSAIYLVIVLYLAGKQIISGAISIGAFSAFLGSVLFMIKPIKRLSKVYAIIQQALSSATRIFDILDTETYISEKKDAVNQPTLKHNILLEHAWFKYDKDYILEDITLEIKRGEIIAIVGPSGVGKTTLVNLIPRFYDPSKGLIKIDGVDLKDITLKSLRDQIGIVTQEMLLFNDTVLNNISYGSQRFSKADIINAAKIANAHEFIVKMPKGYDTVIGERGFRLSGGERQRLSIARAVFKNPPILIFDEATSQLDTESEQLVQEAIDRLMHGRTVFVIAHRLSTITHANRIVVLNEGRIAEIGPHQQLLNKGGLYRKLYDLQFQMRT